MWCGETSEFAIKVKKFDEPKNGLHFDLLPSQLGSLLRQLQNSGVRVLGK